MPPRKRLRTSTSTPGLTIPHEIVLEIVARSDFVTIVRSAGSCRPLRRDILRPGFIRRVFHGPGGGGDVPRRVLGFLHAYDEARVAPPPAALSLAHPATPAAAYFLEKNLAPFVSRSAAASDGLLGDYEPLTSRNDLVVLRRRYVGKRRPDLCVYNPITGDRAFLPGPPDMDIAHASEYGVSYAYVLLTAADGVGGSFLLLAADFTGFTEHSNRMLVQTFSPDAGGGRWGAVTSARHPCSDGCELLPRCGAVVLGGLIHWLMHTYNVFGFEFHILTYDVRTATAGSIELPAEALPDICDLSNLHLASSPDGRLSLLVADRLTVSIWLPLPAGGGWSRHAMIDTAGMLAPSLVPEWPPYWWRADLIKLATSSGVGSGAILLRPFTRWYDGLEKEGGEGLAVLDVEEEEMRVVNRRKHTMNSPYEMDLELQLSAMKIF